MDTYLSKLRAYAKPILYSLLWHDSLWGPPERYSSPSHCRGRRPKSRCNRPNTRRSIAIHVVTNTLSCREVRLHHPLRVAALKTMALCYQVYQSEPAIQSSTTSSVSYALPMKRDQHLISEHRFHTVCHQLRVVDALMSFVAMSYAQTMTNFESLIESVVVCCASTKMTLESSIESEPTTRSTRVACAMIERSAGFVGRWSIALEVSKRCCACS